MTSIHVVSVVAALILAGEAYEQGRDFAGQWAQDRAKTMSARGPIPGGSFVGGGFYAGMTVTQDSSRLTVQTTGPDGKVLETNVYKFDGSESRQPRTVKTTTAKWDGDRLRTTVSYDTTKDGSPVSLVFEIIWYREGDYLVCEQVARDATPHKVYYQRSK